ncbi:MAG: hydroxymethylbilane synthase, partial [Alphaproteobacteria bacterium]|nr:hydroxymethylbilane synthase [Alphaproteobacteria bacterium]
PSILPDGLIIAAMLEREDARDAFISSTCSSFDALPRGAVIGTSSTRRAAQVTLMRPDLNVIGFRGNVGTRIAKLAAGEAHATFLAAAGLNRLGLASHITEAMDVSRMLPAVAQGAIGIECRIDDTVMRDRLKRINHASTMLRVQTERSLLLALDGSCRSPIAAHAIIEGHYISLHAQVIAIDGSEMESGHIMAPLADGEHIGQQLGLSLKRQAARFL